MNNNSKTWWVVGAIVIIIIVIAAAFAYRTPPASTTTPTAMTAEETGVRNAVSGFGAQLQMVSLLAPTTTVAETMQAAYGPYVAPELLSVWERDPSQAPGKLTSSPWPDHIDVTSVTANTDGSYAVTGNVVDMTSTGNGGSYPIVMTLANRDGAWLVTSFSGYPVRGA